MPDVKPLLEYQIIDSQIAKIKSEVDESEEKKVALAAHKAVIDLVAEMKKCETAAAELLVFYNRSAEYSGDNIKKIEELEKRLETAEISDPEFDRLARASRSLYDTFSKMEGSLSGYPSKIEETVKRFSVLRKKYQDVLGAYKEKRAKYDELEASRRPETEALAVKLSAAAALVDAGLLNKYKALRADKLNRCAVPLNNKQCGGCGMEMSLSVIENIKSKGWVECDNCRRIIYK